MVSLEQMDSILSISFSIRELILCRFSLSDSVNNQIGTDVVIQGSTSQQKLCANVAAQIVAFACGKEDENRNKNFEGGRPSQALSLVTS